MDTTSYWVDGKDLIIRLSSSWDDFALENGGKSVITTEVIGRPLFDYIAGDPSRMWMETVLKLVRITGKMVEREYRCDTPELRRFMKMQLVPEGGGVVRVDHHVLRTEPRERRVEFIPKPDSTVTITKRCSICGRISSGERWIEADQSDVDALRVKKIPVVYTVCGECWDRMPGTEATHS